MKSSGILLSIAFVLCAAVGLSQAPQPRSTGRPTQPANLWMKAPTDLSLPDATSPSIRYERDRFWDKLIGADSVLTPENGYGVSEGAYLGEPPEILEIPDRAVLIGTFAGSASILTSSERAIYTEVNIAVGHVFEDVNGHANAGGNIVIIFPGGTVKTRAGQMISFLTQPRSYFVQPKKTYLLILQYHADGDFYIFGKDWDMSDGTVRADSPLDQKRQKEGRSSLVGLTTQQLIRSLNTKFSKFGN